jgi:hypothetical protein
MLSFPLAVVACGQSFSETIDGALSLPGILALEIINRDSAEI